MVIVPDIHIYIAGTTSQRPDSYTALIINAWQSGSIQVAASESILAELAQVLTYPDVIPLHNWTAERQAAFIDAIRHDALMVEGTTSVTICDDPKDNKLFSCALEAQAAYLVSKDKKVLAVGEYQGIKTVKPGYFVEQVLAYRKAA
jgi:putative PIN family toxin of toxin-antitoxin system